MKELNPRTPKHNPNGWVRVYDAFRSFKNIAAKTGESTGQWALFHADTFKEKLSKGKNSWEIRYSLGGTHYVVFVGHDVNSAVAGIKEMIRVYPKHKRQEPSKPVPKAVKYDPKHDPNYIRKLFEEWQQVIKKVGHSISPAAYEKDHAPKFKLLTVKAGILPMNMRQYLTNHPHAEYWPVPPLNEDELRRRNHEFETMLRQRESRKRQEQGW